MPILAIPIVQETVAASQPFFAQPIDVILFQFIVWFGWIPIAWMLGWGFLEMWINWRMGIYAGGRKYVLLAIDVPAITEQSPKALENLFSNMYGAKSSITWKEKWIYGKLHPVFSFEIVSTEGYLQFLVRTQTRFRDMIEANIYAHYPDAEISEVEDYTRHFPTHFPNDDYEMWGSEVKLENDYIFPIRTYVDFEDRLTQEIKDPLGQILEQMAKMRPGEHFWWQILVQPSSNDWKDKGIAYVNSIYGIEEKKKKGFFEEVLKSTLSWPLGLVEHATDTNLSALLFSDTGEDETDPWKAFKMSLLEKETAEAVLRKTNKVGHGVKMRVLYVAKKNAFVKVERTAILKGMLNQFTNLNLNGIKLYIPSTPKDDYFWMRWSYRKRQERLMSAYVNRSWGTGNDPMWLNAEELATLWHFPTISIRAPLIKKSESKRAEPPVGLPISFGDEDLLPGIDESQTASGSPILPGVGLGDGPAVKGEPPFGLPGAEDDALAGPDISLPDAPILDHSGVSENVPYQPPVEPLETEELPGIRLPTPDAPTKDLDVSVQPTLHTHTTLAMDEEINLQRVPEDEIIRADQSSPDDLDYVPPNLPV